MNNKALSLTETAREAYALQVKASADIREKSLHFYNERRADGGVSAIGRIRKFTSSRKSDAAIGALFSGTSGLAFLVANQIQQASEAATALLKNAAEKIKNSFGASTNSASSLSDRFHVETQFVNDTVVEAIQTHKDVALRDAYDMASGEFIGPMRAETQELVNAVRNGTSSFEDFQTKLFERRGLIEMPSNDFDVAVSAERLNAIRSAFSNSNGANSVFVYSPLQKVVTPALDIKPPSYTPAFSAP